MIHYRPLDPERDDPALAALLNLTSKVPVTPEMLRQWRERADAGRVRIQLVAVDADDQPVAVGDCVRDPWMPAGQFWIDVIVRPDDRGQGIGAHLYAACEAWAVEQGALYLGDDVRDDQPEGLRFAEARGFKKMQHTVDHRLDLPAFDPNAFAPVRTALEGDGFAFLSYAETEDRRDHRKAIYKLNKRTVVDDPSFVGSHLPYDEYSRRVFESPWARSDELLIATRGDRWVGFTQLADFPESGAVVSLYTGVEREYRRRGLATALIAQALAHARGRGAQVARLSVDGRDEAMQGIAARLGFTADPGSYRMVRLLPKRGALQGKN